MDEKTCTKCSKLKPLNQFVVAKGRADGTLSHCKECHRAIAKESRLKTQHMADPMARPLNAPTVDNGTLLDDNDPTFPTFVAEAKVKADNKADADFTCSSCGIDVDTEGKFCDWCDPNMLPEPANPAQIALIDAGFPEGISTSDTMPDMTKAEAEAEDTSMRRNKTQTAIKLYLMARRNGFQHFGFDSISAYAAARLDESNAVVSYWLAQVEATVACQNITLKDLTMLSNEIGGLPKLLPQTVTRELAKLPTREAKRKVFKLMQDLKNANVTTVGVAEWKRLVKQELGKGQAWETPPQPRQDAPQAPPALKVVTPPAEPEQLDFPLPLTLIETPKAQPLHIFPAKSMRFNGDNTALLITFVGQADIEFCVSLPAEAIEFEKWEAD